MTQTLALQQVPPDALGTTLGHVRIPTAAQMQKMRLSLTQHGQLQPIVGWKRQSKLEIIDGFKRHKLATAMAWSTLSVRVMPADDKTQWTLMLALNHASSSISELEEAMVLRQLVLSGMTQVQVAQILGRHKSWVSRRIGLVDRLDPSLVEDIRLGLLSTGVARRLLSLPPGNQREMAARVQAAGLGPHEVERWLRLYHSTADLGAKSYVLEHPREALDRLAAADRPTPPDPRLCPRSQRLQRALRLLIDGATRTESHLHPPPQGEEEEILREDLEAARRVVPRVARLLGCWASSDSDEGSVGSGAMFSSDDAPPRETASAPSPAI